MAGIFKKFLEAAKPRKFCSVIVAAAGSSSRMGGEDKLLREIHGIPVLARTLRTLEDSTRVDEIIVAVRQDSLVTVADLCKRYVLTKRVKLVTGGATRAESVLRATMEVDARAEIIAVQDGARPFASIELVDRVIEAAQRFDAAAPALPVKDTIKVAEGSIVRQTPDRKTLFAVQTPQAFNADILKAALQSAVNDGVEVTDDCAAVERLGKQIYLTDGAEENIKITTPFDLVVADAIISGGLAI
ncbi:MAG: 2-C-methyl-D-erythritol 4-phosphate cytidylyltransferase [Oscillospiraceae bacterium]|nr:2-C-methyl-D-erythritol 4-phosphate cytidylyltransferase [Oscillospiraceae bacterium]